MQTTKTKKLSHVFAIAALTASVIAWITPAGYYQQALENDFIKSLKKKLTEYNAHAPEDRVYLQLDKPFYSPGDDVWVSAYIRDGVTLKPSNKSDIIHIELISPKGTIEIRINEIGRAHV